ncbi:hypothetical protein UGMREWDR_CDS0115 [Aeromonas phage GomatiRiver_11]|nr:hypothetical protein UGMREWDR_CDS0115 [Aeromonas phage GomatiRiver_11]
MSLNLADILDSAMGETELVSYFVKLHMRDNQIPVKIHPSNISWQPFEVDYGKLDWSVDTATLTMDIQYAS